VCETHCDLEARVPHTESYLLPGIGKFSSRRCVCVWWWEEKKSVDTFSQKQREGLLSRIVVHYGSSALFSEMEPWRDDGGYFESRKSKIGHLIRRRETPAGSHSSMCSISRSEKCRSARYQQLSTPHHDNTQYLFIFLDTLLASLLEI
jgi:hypothetical protein